MESSAVGEETRHNKEGEEIDENDGRRPGERTATNCRKEREPRRLLDLTRDKPVRLSVKVVVPVKEHPKFNFVGKLLGPKGNSLKRLQEGTQTKMAILGRGSMKDKRKEEELRLSGDPKFSHLHDDLHIEISAFAAPAEAYARIAFALADVRRFLVPDHNDDIRQQQMWEIEILKDRTGASRIFSDVLHSSVVGSQGTTETLSSPSSSRSQSPKTQPFNLVEQEGPVVVLSADQPALRGLPVRRLFPFVLTNVGATPGRKRPLPQTSQGHFLSPKKRPLLSLLAQRTTPSS